MYADDKQFFSQSFQYAASFQSTLPSQPNNYSLPAYLAPGQGSGKYGAPHQGPDSNHITALHESLIPNWTSPNFIRFVDACKAIVDELANAQTTGNGRQEMGACERVFKQAVWLWSQVWPEVDGMGEENDLDVEPDSPIEPQDDATMAEGDASGGTNGNGAEKPVEREDEDAEATPDSPYGGLGAIAAANRAAL